MAQGFMPVIGNYYDRIRIDKNAVSRDAAYFEQVISNVLNYSDSTRLIDTSSSVVIWCGVEYACLDMGKHLATNGISYSYDFVQFTVKHANYIEGYDFTSEEDHGDI
jgi:hypothetical protein